MVDVAKYSKKVPKMVSPSLKKFVKRVINGRKELKCFEEAYAESTLKSTSQVIVPFSNVAQGDTGSTRDGNVIEGVRIQARVAVKTTAAVPRCAVRCTVVKYKQCDGTLPTLADIFPNANSAIGNIWADLPLTAGDYAQEAKKFDVIYDKVKHLASATDDASGAVHFNINKRIPGKIYFTGANGTDEGNNQYYLFIHTDNTDDDLKRIFVKRIYYRDA